MHFKEFQGGQIIDKFGRIVVTIQVDQLTVEQAHRAMKAVLGALEKEFYPKDADTILTQPLV